jgi:RNA polymerase sigma factor (sigma-70 family)
VDTIDFWIGAAAENNLSLPDDPTLSGMHARIRFADNALRVHDNGSTNGTWLNGVRIDETGRLLGSGDLLHLDPRELLQDTFVNVYRYPTAFREEHSGSFRVWVRTIAGNIVRRARGAERRISFQELPDGLQEPEDERENPFRRAVSIEQESLVQGAWVLFLCLYACAWRELGQRDRRTLHLVEVEGLSYQEAGRILAVGRSNMKMIVFRSRKRIARQMRAVLAPARLRPSVA